MTGVPHVRMLASADLVIDIEDVKVSFGAQVDDAQVASRDEPDQAMARVVSGNHESCGPVPLAERADELRARVPRSKST